jgi:hypothetical protein
MVTPQKNLCAHALYFVSFCRLNLSSKLPTKTVTCTVPGDEAGNINDPHQVGIILLIQIHYISTGIKDLLAQGARKAINLN